MLDIDTTRLDNVRPAKQVYASITDLDPLSKGLSVIPREVEVQLRDVDGPKQIAMWRGLPTIVVGTGVRCWRAGGDTSILEVAGGGGSSTTAVDGVITTIVSKSGAYTLVATDYTVLCDATSAAFTITLPASASHTGRIYNIKKIDSSANAVTVDGNASETIDGDTTRLLNRQYDSITIQCDGSNWHIL